MPKIKWDQPGEKLYETGVDHCIVYPQVSGAYPLGVAWNGISSIQESPSGAEASDIYADNIKYLSLMSAEQLGLTIEAYTYPDEFAVLDGTADAADGVYVGQQTRKPFGLVYRTVVGNDTDENDHGYKLHLVYNCKASPSEKQFQTINDSPEAISFSWSVNTTPVVLESKDKNNKVYKPTAMITIDSTKADPTKLAALLAILEGTDGEGVSTGTDPMLPDPDTVIGMFAGTSNP